MKDLLYDKVYGALVGAAIGDAMGGPIEMYSFEKIEALHGWVDRFLPYGDDFPPNAHGAWSQEAGTYTDDSRTSKIFCQAILAKDGPLQKGDLERAYIGAYHRATEKLEREFLEDYYFKAVYGERKLIFGGQPANAAIMGIAPFGALFPCDPAAAFEHAFDVLFSSEGYARYAAPMAASAIAAAMIPGIRPREVIARMQKAITRQKSCVEGEIFAKGGFYDEFCRKNERMVENAVEIADRHQDTKALRQELRDSVTQSFFGDATETLAVAVCMFLAAGGSYRGTVEGCLNYGRDNDSSASVGGALAGAFGGASAIPPDWITVIEEKNVAPTFADLAQQLCAVIRGRHVERAAVLSDEASLLGV